MPRRIMREFRMNEISGVDLPAQKGALATFMKRQTDATANGLYLAKRDGESPLPAAVEDYLKREFSQDARDRLASSGAALPDGSFPIENRADLRNAVRAYGRAKSKPKAKAHIISRARALGATSTLPDTWKSANFPLLATLTNDEIVQGFDKALDAFKAEQKAADFNSEQADAECREYANGLLEEVTEAVCSLRSVFDEIIDDDAIKDKDEALQESFDQFKAHLKGIIPEGVENGLVGAALHEAGYKVNERGALTKRETESMFDIRKALGLAATATDADVSAALAKQATAGQTLANFLKMSAAHCSYMNDERSKMPEGGKEAFTNMTAEQRDAHIKSNPLRQSDAEKRAAKALAKAIAKAQGKKPAEEDDDLEDDLDDDDAEKCIKTADGTVIRKSEVGPAMFQFMKNQQAEIAKMVDERATAVFAKRAETAMGYIGKSDEIGGLLMSISKLAGGDKVAEAVAKKFEQLNEVIKKGGAALFKEAGGANAGGGGGLVKAKDQIEVLAKQLVADNKAKSIFKARDMVRNSNPELRKQEQDEEEEEKQANKGRRAA